MQHLSRCLAFQTFGIQCNDIVVLSVQAVCLVQIRAVLTSMSVWMGNMMHLHAGIRRSKINSRRRGSCTSATAAATIWNCRRLGVICCHSSSRMLQGGRGRHVHVTGVPFVSMLHVILLWESRRIRHGRVRRQGGWSCRVGE